MNCLRSAAGMWQKLNEGSVQASFSNPSTISLGDFLHRGRWGSNTDQQHHGLVLGGEAPPTTLGSSCTGAALHTCVACGKRTAEGLVQASFSTLVTQLGRFPSRSANAGVGPMPPPAFVLVVDHAD